MTKKNSLPLSQNRLSIGISGLDEVLCGGLIPRRAYLVRGGPGTGKTTLGFHFLTAGVANSETTLFITLGEAEAQLRSNAQSFGFSLEGISFLDLSPSSDFFTEVQTYDIFLPAEVEREPITAKITEQVRTIKPQRVFLDAMTQFRYLSADPCQFRKQVLSFLRFLVEQGATVLFSSEGSNSIPDDDLQFLSDGIIDLEFTESSRSICVHKFRGSSFREGHHSLHLTETGIEIFPRLLPETFQRNFVTEVISSGIAELDELLHGGLERGTVTIISGPSGVGKTTVGSQFMKEAAGRGERSAMYIFEESFSTLLRRCESINIPVRTMLDQGTLSVIPVEPLLYSPDQFACLVRQEVEERGTQIVMLDSISGYQLSMQGEKLVNHLHSICKYLKNMGVTTILVNEIETISGDIQVTEIGISYLADNIIFMRYMEHHTPQRVEVRKSIGVMKKRVSDFEKTLRELEITRYGLKVGKPMMNLSTILSGIPVWPELEPKK
ncbi:MAG: ATPase domain-containing protein [Actinomycetota bacterium]